MSVRRRAGRDGNARCMTLGAMRSSWRGRRDAVVVTCFFKTGVRVRS
ncbi:hypothetical protein [Streptomyces phaeochromogenes]